MPQRPIGSDLRPVHTPYADGVTPFAIGVSPIDPEDWIEPEPGFAHALAEKTRLIAEKPELVFAETDGSRPAQEEVQLRLATFLPERFPSLYLRDGARTRLRDIETPDDPTEPPLLRAARLAPEDLLIMGPPDMPGASWKLIAGAVCFPSSWSLQEKIGRPLDMIHESVPGFQPGTRNAAVIDRIFDRLRPGQMVGRLNWSIYGTDRLDQPVSKHTGPTVFATNRVAETPHIRVERQTLQKLPETGAILFTVRIHVDGIETLKRHPNAAALAQGLADRLAELNADQIGYKSLDASRDALLSRLRAIADRAAPRSD